MVYNNVNGFPVILADNRNPYTSWTHHRQRGSLGGVDLTAPYGTRVKAPSSGRVTLHGNTGSGGRYITITAADGHQDELMHLSAFLVRNGQQVTRGQVVGRSGASGFGREYHYAPHLHWHRITPGGSRVNPWSYFTKATPAIRKPPKSVYTVRTGKPNEAFIKRLQWYARLNGYKGVIDGEMGTLSWKGVQRGLKHYDYTGAIDGERGPLTNKALQRMARANGYPNVKIDGTMDADSWKGVAKRLNKL